VEGEPEATTEEPMSETIQEPEPMSTPAQIDTSNMEEMLSQILDTLQTEPEEEPEETEEESENDLEDSELDTSPVYVLAVDTETLDSLGIELFGAIVNNYGVGTSYIQIFGGVASKLPYGTHYVYWRENQYEYKMAYSDSLILTGNRFSGTNVTVITYNTYTTSTTQATYYTATETNFSLFAGSYLVWSDLGNYPELYARGVMDYEKLTCIILASFGLYYCFRGLWHSIRQRYIDAG